MKMTGDWTRILKFKCFTPRAYQQLHEDLYANHFLSTPDENTSAESLETPTAASHLNETEEVHQKETIDKVRLRTTTSSGDISSNQSSYDQSIPASAQSESSVTDENNQSKHLNNNGLLHFLGLHFNKSETRHLDRTVSSQQSSQQADIGKGSRKTSEESRYTKLPLSGSAGGSTSVQLGKTKTSHATPLFQIQGRKGEKSSKHLRGKSKSDNNLHRVSIPHLLDSSRSTSTFRFGNDYCERRLNSVQAGDHAPISLPWKQNNLSSVTSQKSHPNTHNNIDANFLRFGHPSSSPSSSEEGGSRSIPTERKRSKSLERTSTVKLSTNNFNIPCNLSANSSKVQERFITRSNSIEYHPHQRVRKTLNQKEQEILRRHILHPESEIGGSPIKSTLPPTEPTNHRPGNIPILDSASSKKGQVEALKRSKKPPDLTSPSVDKLPFSVQNSPRSPTASSPGALSCPPSPPPRPPSTLKAFRSRLVSPSDKVKAQTPSPSPTPTKTPASAFPFPPIMSTRTESPSSSQFQSMSRKMDSGGAEGHVATNGISMASVEEARNSGFINQPAKGWLHADKLLTKEGVTYAVRYIGCHDVNTSMKSLDFDTRSLIAKECINQVCEAAGFKTVDRKRKIDRRLVKILGFKPRLEHAGSDVCLTITSTCLKLTSLDNGAVIAVHEMPNISFASGGDIAMLDFVAYVAKDAVVGRACFVLECGPGLAQDVITTIGQAFELRFKEYLQKRPPPVPKLANNDPEYYNDLPGKLPPENQSTGKIPQNGKRAKATLTLDPTSNKEMAVNLIDFEAPTPPAFGEVPPEKTLESLLLGRGSPAPQTDSTNNAGDPFDMQTLNSSVTTGTRRLTLDEQRSQLETEPWFHGIVSRGEAESLVINDGDFLVRESQASPHQYVLTGLQNGSPKHLLLVDPEGVVRTKDRTFDSVTHLIHHHSNSSRPIISAESIVLLRNPVLKRSP